MDKINRHGCKVCEDVCIEHDLPLVAHDFCEESPDVKDLLAQAHKEVWDEAIGIVEQLRKEQSPNYHLILEALTHAKEKGGG